MTTQDWLWPTLEREFFNDLEVLHKQVGTVDLLLFTGDLIQSGKADEFRKVTDTLMRLYSQLKSLGSNPPLICVPGNHDLSRPKATSPEVRLLKRWSEETELQKEFWNSRTCKYRKVINKAFANYVSWWQSHPFPRLTENKGTLPGDFSASFTKGQLQLGLIGLNSTFLQLTDGDYTGKLAVHASQVHGVCGEHFADWFGKHHLNILLTHQPPSWLDKAAAEAFKSEISPSGRFALHLFGHMHESNYTSSSLGGAAMRHCIQGCSLFGLETFGERKIRQHGYSIGQLSVSSNDSVAALRFWPRKAEKHQEQHWHIVPDSTFTLEPEHCTLAEKLNLYRELNTTERARPSTTSRTKFHVCVLSTDTDLNEHRGLVLNYLKTVLAVEVSDTTEDAASADLVVLIQACWWSSGVFANYWESVDSAKRIGFVVDSNANWPPRKLVERNCEDDIDAFVKEHSDLIKFQDPTQLPELIGEVVTERVSKAIALTAGSTDLVAIKTWERAYLAFRIPSWLSGRTAGRPHVLEPDSGTELYRPELYVPLTGACPRYAWTKSESPELIELKSDDQEFEPEDKVRRAPLARWLSVPQILRIALVGAPGGGKTVFLTRIAASFAHACLGRQKELEPALNLCKLRKLDSAVPIPVVLEASRIEKQPGRGKGVMLSAICEEFEQAGSRPSESEIDAGLVEGRYIVLVDALDEISSGTRRLDILNMLKGMAAHECYPQLRIVITTRSARYTGSLAFGPEFELIDVAPLDEAQVDSFCRNWAAIRKRDQHYITDLKLAVNGLAAQVANDGKEEAMTTNPLMLTAICMVFERYQALPDDRARLCSLLVDDLCRSRNSEDVEHSWRLNDASKRDLLERIALAMQEEGAQSWSVSRAVEIATRGVPSAEPLRQQRANKHLHWAAEHTGLLRFQQPENGEEEIRYWHRLFREFLAASRLSQEDTTVSELVEGLWKKKFIINPFWEDVLRLLPRTLGTLEKVKSLREKLMELSVGSTSHRGRLLGLLAAGIIESRDLYPDVDVKRLALSLANTYEAEGLKWSIRDRMLLLDSLGGLDPLGGDPRITEERWVSIPSGPATIRIGSGQLQRAIVPPLEIAFWPVTVQEFREYLTAVPNGCRTLSVMNCGALESLPFKSTSEWRSQLRRLNYPVVNVTQQDAINYCSWRTSLRTDGLTVRLPTLWEQARVLDEIGVTIPDYGSPLTESEMTYGNLPQLEIGHSSPVGAFSTCGRVGIWDFIGNVFEWPHSSVMGKRSGGALDLYVRTGSCRHIPIRSEHLVSITSDASLDIVGFRCILSSKNNPPYNPGKDVEILSPEPSSKKRRR